VLEKSAEEKRVKPFLKVTPESHIDYAKDYTILWRPRIATLLLMVCANSVLLCDTSTGIPRPFVPASLRKIVFDSLHSLSHPGVRATRHLIATRYVWPKMNKDSNHWTKACPQCQRAKVTRHTNAPMLLFKPSDAHFDVVHIDIVGPLPPSQGYKHLLMCVDRFTCWPEAFPLMDITAEPVARAFVLGWIARFGVPSTVITDRGNLSLTSGVSGANFSVYTNNVLQPTTQLQMVWWNISTGN